MYRNALLISALLVAIPFTGMAASAQVDPGYTWVPVVGQVDNDPSDGVTWCKRIIGLNTCVGVLMPDCKVWVSAGLGGCFVR